MLQLCYSSVTVHDTNVTTIYRPGAFKEHIIESPPFGEDQTGLSGAKDYAEMTLDAALDLSNNRQE